MIKKYILNFWVWWYGAKFVDVLSNAYSFWSLSLANLNILPMLNNLLVPMYQDQSLTGKFLSFILRLTWVFFGSLIQFAITIPIVLVILLWVSAPIICLFEIFKFFI